MMEVRQYIRELPLRTKIFLGTAFGALLVVAASSVVLFSVMHDRIDTDIKKHLSNSTIAIRDLVRTSVTTSIRNRLRAVADKNHEIVAHFYAQYQEGHLDEATAKARAAEVLLSQTIGKTGYIYCIDTCGIVRVHPKPCMRDEDIANYSIGRRQIEQKNGYMEYEWANPDEEKPRPKALYMAYFAPWDWIISASSYRDEFIDLVRLDDFRESVLSHAFGETGYSFIMDTTGTMIIHPKQEGINILRSRDSKGNAFPTDGLDRERGTIVYDWINPGEEEYRKKIGVFESIPEMGWIVVSASYLDEVERPLLVLAYVILGSGVMMLVALFVMSWWVAQMATQPLALLMLGFEEGARGNLSLRMDTDLGGEFGQLAVHYNNFMDALVESRSRSAESEEKYKAIFKQSVEGMFQMLPDGRFENVNPAMASLFGYDDAEAMLAAGRDMGSYYREGFSARDLLFGELLEKGKIVGATVRLERRDGTLFWAEISKRAVYDQDGEMVLVEGLVKDVTAQHEFLKSLSEAKEKAEAASQLKSDFLVMISHEMRTPLTSLLGFSRMAKKHLDAKALALPALSDNRAASVLQRIRGNLEVMEAESTHLAKLIDDLMDFARFKSGEMVLCVKPTPPEELITVALNAMAGPAQEKGLMLTAAVEPDLPLVVVDRERILQVLTQLIGNAVKFTAEGGITISVVQRESAVEFSVADTGSGIPQDSLERIFDQFTQLGDVMTGKPKGTGLGLALCHSIIALHYGRIWAESEPGSGSVFHFTLPLPAPQTS